VRWRFRSGAAQGNAPSASERWPADTGPVPTTDPLGEDWWATFSVIEPGAQVASSARVHDSVVLNGAKVGENTVLVRSVIGPGARIGRNQAVVDQVVGTQNGERR